MKSGFLVIGSGRSGTSLFTMTLAKSGVTVPARLVPSDPSNPRGFYEPEFVVDLHNLVLSIVGIKVNDARSSSSALVRSFTRGWFRPLIRRWLKAQMGSGVSELVIKDPRLVWFIDSWSSELLEIGVRPIIIVMLRDPREVVGSKSANYGLTEREESFAAWCNLTLISLASLQGTDGAIVKYSDLLRGPVEVVESLGRKFGIANLASLSSEVQCEVAGAIDSSLYRNRADGDPGEVEPQTFEALALEIWEEFSHPNPRLVNLGGFERRYKEAAACTFGGASVRSRVSNILPGPVRRGIPTDLRRQLGKLFPGN